MTAFDEDAAKSEPDALLAANCLYMLPVNVHTQEQLSLETFPGCELLRHPQMHRKMFS